MPEKKSHPSVDLEWDDEDVLPPVLSRDTEFVFHRMTQETLKATDMRARDRVLDVGCGRALDAAALARKGGILFGCEPSRVMIRKAKEGLTNNGGVVRLVRSLGESLPFAGHVFDRVFCKGAIDHFFDLEKAVAEMCRVTCPGGKVVISVANFESLSCFWARNLNRLHERFRGKEIPPPHIWKVPPDHTHKLDYQTLLNLTRPYLRIESLRGVSLFWGFPRWAKILEILPKPLALILLRGLDKIATRHPHWSDVLVVVGTPRGNAQELERSP